MPEHITTVDEDGWVWCTAECPYPEAECGALTLACDK